MDFVVKWSRRTGLKAGTLTKQIGVSASKFHDWKRRHGSPNEHNTSIPRNHWLENWEKDEVIAYYRLHPDNGYRRAAYMMLDEDIVAVSPSSVYRVLSEAGEIRTWQCKESRKGKGFTQPLAAHEHWHIDVTYVNICGTFYYMCSILDGFSRFIVHHEIREQMQEQDVEVIVQRALEAFPGVTPRIISDNGPQFIAKDFKAFLKMMGMDQVRTSPYYPQSNGKLERWHRSLKNECIRPKTPLSLEDARRVVGQYVEHYNTERLHSSLGYITPADKLHGKQKAIEEKRQRKLAEARERRAEDKKVKRQRLDKVA